MGCGAPTPEIPNSGHPHAKINTENNVTELSNRELSKIHSLMEREQYKQAIPLLKQYLELNFDKSVQIDGLGNYEAALGYYECFPYTFYIEGVKNGTFKGTAIDLLNLCIMNQRLEDEILWDTIDWYKKMIEEHDDCYQLKFGYGTVISNQGYYDQAVENYVKTIQLKSDFLPAYENIAYVYEYKRIQVSKSTEWARKALKVDPNSIYAQFVLAKNQADVDQRIRKVKEVCEKCPKYARIINFVGFIYGQQKKMPEEAIIWHKKAVEAIPLFDIGNYNVGMRYEQMEDYKNAIYYYLQANRFDKDYRLPCNKLVPIFIKLKYTDDEIDAAIKEHDVKIDYIYYNMGKSYYDLNHNDLSLKYYAKAQSIANELKKQLDRLYNSTANTYLKMKKYDTCIEFFDKAKAINPKLDMLYYNSANVYKEMGKLDLAIQNHKKCIQVNPRYSYPYNNLGNIYSDQGNYDQAIKCFKLAVKHKSNYVLAMANLGVNYLKIQNYRQAFNAISRATQLLQANKKDLSPGNIQFLSETLQKFDKEGEMWRQSGSISPEDRVKLRKLIQSFEAKFSKQFSGEGKIPVNKDKVMKKEILQIITLVAQNKFQMGPIDQIYDLVKKIFQDNEEYFHLVPQLFIQYFYSNVLIKKRPVAEVQRELFEITKKLSKKTADMVTANQKQSNTIKKLKDFKLSHFDPPNEFKVNLFKVAYFSDYYQIYNQIMQVDTIARSHYKEYKELTDKIKIQSKGIPYGIGLKIPKSQSDQFKVILRIFQKMFKTELTSERVIKIINKIEKGLQEQQKKKAKVSLLDVVRVIMDKWTAEIDEIVKTRKQKKIETKFQISDLLRAKIMYDSTENLKKALQAVDKMCFQKNYKIIEMVNRLDKQQTQDVVLKIQIEQTVCQLQLAMQQEEAQYHFIHSIYEIERSPLGCIFGSYIFMSKGFNYPFIENCKDVVEHLKNPQNEEQKQTLQAAEYIVANLSI